MFSSRLRQTAVRNRLAQALERRRLDGLPVIDLTLSNPTRAGLSYPPALLEPLAQDRARCYEPAPFGLSSARQAVAEDFARRGVTIAWNRIVLTASTSEAYSLLFKLLCDPGDTVLVPRPSYPLVEYLTELDGVLLEHYALDFHGNWSIDVHGLRERLSAPTGARIKAVVMISPNNPTGSLVSDAEIDDVAALAHDHDAVLICDEVFADYPMSGTRPPSVLRQDVALSFALGGLSKTVGLPQLKLAWIGVGGPEDMVSNAMDRLETICDAYLSVSTPVQVAAADLLTSGACVRAEIRRRVRENLEQLHEVAVGHPACSVLPVEAGWYAVVQVPAIESEESIVLDLLERTGVLVHPGYFFDFDREAFLVLSLLPEPGTFGSAVRSIFREVGAAR
jgi:aspartate/methionine/tyrosine aminotransferase